MSKQTPDYEAIDRYLKEGQIDGAVFQFHKVDFYSEQLDDFLLRSFDDDSEALIAEFRAYVESLKPYFNS